MSSKQSKGAAELADLFPESKEVVLTRETLVVAPLTIRQLGQVAHALKRVADSTDDYDLTALIANNTEDMIAAVAAATGRPAEWAANLMPHEFMSVSLAIFEVNRDFFARHVAPLIDRAKGMTAALGDGPTLSPSSTAAASPTPAT